MKVKVLFFGIAKEISEVNSIKIELTKESNVFDFIEIMKAQYSGFSSINDFSIAVNEEYANNDVVLKDSDIVAIIPPVSGG